MRLLNLLAQRGGASQSVPHTPSPRRLISLRSVTRGREIRGFQDSYICMHTLPVEVAMPPLTFKLVMVHTGCHGRHSHCGSDDSAGTITLLGRFAY